MKCLTSDSQEDILVSSIFRDRNAKRQAKARLAYLFRDTIHCANRMSASNRFRCCGWLFYFMYVFFTKMFRRQNIGRLASNSREFLVDSDTDMDACTLSNNKTAIVTKTQVESRQRRSKYRNREYQQGRTGRTKDSITETRTKLMPYYEGIPYSESELRTFRVSPKHYVEIPFVLAEGIHSIRYVLESQQPMSAFIVSDEQLENFRTGQKVESPLFRRNAKLHDRKTYLPCRGRWHLLLYNEGNIVAEGRYNLLPEK